MNTAISRGRNITINAARTNRGTMGRRMAVLTRLARKWTTSCVLLGLMVVQPGYGDVLHGVPPGTNEVNWLSCGSFGQVTFEGLSEASVLGEVIPGVKFTTTAGQDWLVGRWSSGNYNGKYPTRGIYTSEGDAWAWLGPSQGRGVITFTQGLASYFSLFTSTVGGVTIDAYDQNGNFLANSGSASSNVGTGTMDKLTISRPTPDIKSIQVHDSANYWIVDDLCTDAPGVACGSLNVPDYKQFTGTWATEEYDSTGENISALGCGLTSVVDILRSYGFTNVNGQDVNPSTLNVWLEDHNGYDVDGNLQWWAIDTYITFSLSVMDSQPGQVTAMVWDNAGKLLYKISGPLKGNFRIATTL
jgi:hypothetical protein